MNFYCNTWGNIFCRQTHLKLLKVSGFVAVFWLLGYMTWKDEFVGQRIVVHGLLGLIGFLIAMMAVFRGDRSRFVTVEQNCISWHQTLADPRYRRFQKYREFHLVTLKVENIRGIVFKQTAVERYFNVGRVCFAGDIRSIEDPNGNTPPVVLPKLPYEFAGVKSFRRFKEYLRQQLPPSAFN